MMGGEVGVQSELGKGSRFWFSACLNKGKVQSAINSEPTTDEALTNLRERHAGIRVLVVDDVEMNRELAIELLADTGLAIDTAVDGREAVNKASTTEYAAILMDMQMPEMDGLAATRLIRKLEGRQETPIIAMTANAFAEDRRACEEAGMVDFLAKPIEPSQLYRILDFWLSKSTSPPMEQLTSSNVDETVYETDVLQSIDFQQGLSIWGGKIEPYKEYLGKFSQAYSKAAQSIQRNVDSRDMVAAGALAHKLKGAAANLALVGVSRIAGEIEQTLRFSDPVDFESVLAERIAQLEKSLSTAEISIASYTQASDKGTVAAHENAAPAALNPDQKIIVGSLLKVLLAELDTDDPGRAIPVLAQLESQIPKDQLATVVTAVEGFDCRGAEIATRQLASRLNIPLVASDHD